VAGFFESKSSKFSLFIRGNFFIWGLKDVVGNYSKSEFSSKGARWHTFDASCIQQHYNCKCCLSPKLSRTESTAKRLAAHESKLNLVSDRALLIPSRPCRTRSDQPRVLAHLVSTLDAVTDAVGGTADIRALIASLLALIRAADNDLHPPCPSSRPPGPGSTARTARTTVSDTSRTNLFVAWHLTQEQRAVTNPHVNGAVVRPALLYFRSAVGAALQIGVGGPGF
jgi:hypothetical protein